MCECMCLFLMSTLWTLKVLGPRFIADIGESATIFYLYILVQNQKTVTNVDAS